MKIKNVRIKVFIGIIFTIFTAMLVRLAYLQVVKGEDYRIMAEETSDREVATTAPRGELLDRNGIQFATNKQCFNIAYSYSSKNTSTINKTFIDVVNILYKKNEQDKINSSSLPISYDESTGTFKFTYSGTDETVKKLEDSFKESNKLDTGLDAIHTVYKLGEKYGIITLKEDGTPADGTELSDQALLKVVALRQAIKSISYRQYQDITIASNVDRDTAFEIEALSSKLEGVSIKTASIRYYPLGEVGSAFLGYVGKISSDSEVEKYSGLGYNISSELIGKTGLEAVCENNSDLGVALRGEPGIEYIKVDKLGRKLGVIGETEAIPGDTVVTTIDANLQKVAESSLDATMEAIRNGTYGKTYPNANRGAVVVIDIDTGEILALASRPGFDPNVFAETGGITDYSIYQKYFLPGEEDPYDKQPKPMFNYATAGTAPPGSTFKVLTAIAGLEEGKITPSEYVYDTGIYRYGSFAGACWHFTDYGTGHGNVDVRRALQVSCNYYFFEVGKRLGQSGLSKWSYKFGISTDPDNPSSSRPSTGIEIAENAGTVGNPMETKRKTIGSTMSKVMKKLAEVNYGGYTFIEGTEEYNTLYDMFMYNKYDQAKLEGIGITNEKAQKYIKQQVASFEASSSYAGDALNISIGQGSTSLTPLQMAQFYATWLNGGTRYKAHLIKEVRDSEGNVISTVEPTVLSQVDIKPETIEIVKEGMAKVTEEGGTAASVFRNYPIKTGGKTGSAEFSSNSAAIGRAAYSWFASFAPYDNPEIAVVAVIYDGNKGYYTSMIVKAIYDEYFGLNKPVETPTTEPAPTTETTATNP